MKNNPILLVSVAILVLLKFVVLPIIEWQNEMILEAGHLQKKIDKSKSHIKRMPELYEYQRQLEASLTLVKAKVERYNNENRYQISKQREFESLFKKHKLTITSSHWKDVIKSEEGATFQLQMQFRGMLKDLIVLQTEINLMRPSVTIGNLGVNIQGQQPNSLGSMTGNMVVVFRPVESTDAAI